ncbi:DapH/DapD/GlmU-related protein, partial [Streptomyces flaveolus]|uniref:CatB-related O-acetyltransferase n=1 Tax=Streptomyces flaveolus TaxID=67297 RepID=UPI003435D401
MATYPFATVGGRWAQRTLDVVTAMPRRGDTVVGDDVWVGYRTAVMPGVRIGDGAIVAAGTVVTADVPPYTIVGGNPAKVIRQRSDDADVERLLRAAWWYRPADLVTEHTRTILAGTPTDIERIAAETVDPEPRAAVSHVETGRRGVPVEYALAISDTEDAHRGIQADRRRFLLNLICFAACIEGLFFYGAFAYVYW